MSERGAGASKRVVLVGGGLSHLHCLRELCRGKRDGMVATVVSPATDLMYSGMLPGWMAGHYALDSCRVPIAALARAAGARFINGEVAAVDAACRKISLVDGSTLDYDVLSIAVGSAIDTRALPGADAHAILVRPLEVFAARWLELKQRVEAHGGARIVVVGAGAGGVEIALAARHAFAGARDVQLAMVSSTSLLPGPSGPRMRRHLQAADIVVHNGVDAIGVDKNSVHLADGARIEADAAIIATGSAAPGWLAASGLPVDPAGYVRVEPTLAVVSLPGVFASGDCASIEGAVQARSGVNALRMGPALLANLRRCVSGGALAPYSPRQRALHLVSAGDRYAVGVWGGLTFEGRWVWHWKDRIDRAFIARHTPGGSARR